MIAYFIKITKKDTYRDLHPYLPLLGKVIQHRITRYKKPIDYWRSLLGHLSTKIIIRDTYGIPISKQRHSVTNYGQPFIQSKQEIHYSISHSGSWVTSAVANIPIGIDIEAIGKHVNSIITNFLTKNELQYINTFQQPDIVSKATQLWTLKESYSKGLGTGLSEGFNTLELTPSNGSFKIAKNGTPVPAHFHSITSLPNHHFSLCSISSAPHPSVHYYNVTEFLDLI